MDNVIEARIQVTGQSYLTLNNMEGADPGTELFREKRELVNAGRGKSQLTEAQTARLRRIEWELSLYRGISGELTFPTYNIIQCMTAAARNYKLGATLERGAVAITETEVPIEYEGPRDLDELWASGTAAWTTFVNGNPSSGKGSSKIQLTRPRLRPWALSFTAEVDVEMIDWPEFEKVVHTAGRVGLGNARKLGHGRFTADIKQL